ncbi:MAG: polysaccharide biosynthesis protein [Thermoplasmata archaeon]|nr:polysaccharide biosynthesis protein [Thermoplasmata archaeon]
MSLKKKIMRNTAANIIIKFWVFGLNLLVFSYVVNNVGAEMFGIWLLVSAVTGYFGLLDLGITPSLVKYVAEYTAKKEEETINRMVNSTFIFFSLIGLIIAVSLFLVKDILWSFFNISPGLHYLYDYIVYITAATTLSSWGARSFQAVYGGLQRYDIQAKVNFLTSTLDAFVAVAVIYGGWGITGFIFAKTVVLGVSQVVNVIVIKRLAPYISIEPRYIDLSSLKKIWRFSSLVFTAQISTIIIFGTDRIVAGAFISAAAVTMYATVRKIHEIINVISNLPASALLPAVAEMDALEEEEKIRRLIFRGGRYRVSVTLSVLVPIFVLTRPILRVWMGDDYTSLDIIAKVYISYWFIMAGWGVVGMVLLGKEKFKPMAILALCNAIMNLVLSLILVRYYGLMGIIVGTVLPYAVVLPIYYVFLLPLSGVGLREYSREVWAKTYPAAGVSFLFCQVFYWLLPFGSGSRFLDLVLGGSVGIATILLYWLIFVFLGMDREERRDIISLLKSLWKRG